jgi:hypothetical protein
MAPQGSLPLSQETISGFCYYSAINGGVVGAGSGAVTPGRLGSKGRQMGGKVNTLHEKQIIFSLNIF